MRAELIAVGTELLMGEVINSNTSYLADWCTQFNLDVYHHQIVGDNEQRLLDVFNQAWKRSDVVLITGGLGPTPDDLTKQTIAKYFELPLIMDELSVKGIKLRYEQLQKEITPNNWNQAKYIKGGIPLNNPNGLAVGVYYKQNSKHLFIFPGPPYELKEMFEQSALPILKKLFNQEGVLESRVIRLFGIGESVLANQLNEILMNQTNPTIALYALPNEVMIRLTAQSDTTEKAISLINQLENQISSIIAPYVYGYGREQALEEIVVQHLIDQNISVATAESLTGGLIAHKFSNVSGASSVFKGGMVTYQTSFKEKWLNIPQEIIDKEGVVSAEVAKQMAQSIKYLAQSDVGIGITGVAGPSTLNNKPVGTVFLAIAKQDKIYVYEEHFGGNRLAIQERSAMQALFYLKKLF
ncbi:competence/damage-inducible protein A [Atopobacter phocae]|uniref:competence/damage-inducible protein A n=1 Tax=Atopobacter phocae TaxID=136492 RepID=UPI00046EFA48|nr:competence/damage-inducible protein A [Atopobacter phocae]